MVFHSNVEYTFVRRGFHVTAVVAWQVFETEMDVACTFGKNVSGGARV
jgi:hypothetical protein